MGGWCAQTFHSTMNLLMAGQDINVPIDGGDLNGEYPTLFIWGCGNTECSPIQYPARKHPRHPLRVRIVYVD